MKTSTANRPFHWHDILYDRRLWGLAGIVSFIAFCTVVIVIGAGNGVRPLGPYHFVWPYGPYGPIIVP